MKPQDTIVLLKAAYQSQEPALQGPALHTGIETIKELVAQCRELEEKLQSAWADGYIEGFAYGSGQYGNVAS